MKLNVKLVLELEDENSKYAAEQNLATDWSISFDGDIKNLNDKTMIDEMTKIVTLQINTDITQDLISKLLTSAIKDAVNDIQTQEE